MTNNGYQHFAEAPCLRSRPQGLNEAIRHAEFCMKHGDTDMAAHWQATIEEVRNFKMTVPCKMTEYSCAA